jgi:hypothetical protein
MKRIAAAWLVCLALGCGGDLTYVGETNAVACAGVMLDGECAPCTRGVVTAKDAQCPDDADVLVCEDDFEPAGYWGAPVHVDGRSPWCSATSPCAGKQQYDPCESPVIPGGGACVGGVCSCYADAQCQDTNGNTNNYCLSGVCVAD